LICPEKSEITLGRGCLSTGSSFEAMGFLVPLELGSGEGLPYTLEKIKIPFDVSRIPSVELLVTLLKTVYIYTSKQA